MEDKEQLLESLYLQALSEPMDYFPHDTNTFDDDAYWAFFQEQGYNGTGIYWQLVPLLTRKKGHSYKVGDKRLLNELYITEEQWDALQRRIHRLRQSAAQCGEVRTADIQGSARCRDDEQEEDRALGVHAHRPRYA